MKKQTKHSKIISLLQMGKKPKDIAKELKTSLQSVYSAQYVERKKSARLSRLNQPKRIVLSTKKRGRPRKPLTVTVSTSNKQLISKVILEDKVESLQVEIANLKHQIVGFRAVISYLEDLAGIRNSQ